MKTLLAILALALADDPLPRKFDLSKVTEADIIATVEHMQRLTKEAQDKLATAQKETGELKMSVAELKQDLREASDATRDAKTETAAMQTAFDAQAAKLESLARAREFWKKWALIFGLVDAVLLIFIFRKPVAKLFGIPLP